MKYREFNCIVCGAKDIDRSRTRTKKFCSESCARLHFSRSKGIGFTYNQAPSCMFNDALICKNHKCGSCGWNPRVEQKRKEAMAYG